MGHRHYCSSIHYDQPCDCKEAMTGAEAASLVLPSTAPTGEEAIERAVERATDRFDAMLMNGRLDQAEYDDAMRVLQGWADRAYGYPAGWRKVEC